ncbi:MAG: circadian clock protein KaiB [Planctomycetes bacterium]|nr:circadian clock protein KaiB [Planctomycetota bacterium]
MTTEKTRAEQASESEGRMARYRLRLFIAGDEINSAAAKASLDRICAEDLGGDCRIEIVDILRDARLAVAEGIVVTPALLITGPGLRTVVLGNLTDAGKVRAALQRGSEKP